MKDITFHIKASIDEEAKLQIKELLTNGSTLDEVIDLISFKITLS